MTRISTISSSMYTVATVQILYLFYNSNIFRLIYLYYYKLVASNYYIINYYYYCFFY